jgi:methionyl-tRNA synthetase
MPSDTSRPYYITTPIYYVNDRPHIGHCYTTTLADVAARAQRLIGRDVFFLTGTDEHADKVSKAAHERGKTPHRLGRRERGAVQVDAFEFMRIQKRRLCAHDGKPPHRTGERPTSSSSWTRATSRSGDYEGWYDPGQEEYVTESSGEGAATSRAR